jgi:FkbM family methyltransferase
MTATHVSFRWTRFFWWIPAPVLLPFGAWWIARNDNLGRPVREGRFETSEIAFVGRFLKPGMTVLDLGAHHGLYTLLASKRVGLAGRVIAFEPSPREKKALLLHLKLNRCKNAEVHGLALGAENADADLYLAKGRQSGCNSLRPPERIRWRSTIRVHVAKLDDWLAERGVERVHFIKLDVEGAEMAVLKGAERLLARRPRPVFLVEVQDIRTRPWGYRAKEIIDLMCARSYNWFRPLADGSLAALDLRADEFDGNYVACPEESTAALEGFRVSNGRTKP